MIFTGSYKKEKKSVFHYVMRVSTMFLFRKRLLRFAESQKSQGPFWRTLYCRGQLLCPLSPLIWFWMFRMQQSDQFPSKGKFVPPIPHHLIKDCETSAWWGLSCFPMLLILFLTVCDWSVEYTVSSFVVELSRLADYLQCPCQHNIA